MGEDAGTTLGCWLGVLIGLGIIAWSWYSVTKSSRETAKKRAQAKVDYESALEKIKLNPTDPNLHQQALELGRRYAGFQPGRTEIMLLNEINAASAGAGSRQPFSSATEIKKLTALLEEGILTQEEWQSAKNQLVGLKPDQSNQVDDAVKLLRALHQMVTLGGLTEGEYNMKKWEILSQRLVGPKGRP